MAKEYILSLIIRDGEKVNAVDIQVDPKHFSPNGFKENIVDYTFPAFAILDMKERQNVEKA